MGRRADWEKVDVQLPTDLKDKLEELAASDAVSLSAEIRLLIKAEYQREIASKKQRPSPEQSGDGYDGTYGKPFRF